MIARGLRPRSGITLTEILIAILIMGVGLISLATLFPLGLLRLREASRNSRAGLAFETAADDMDTRALFYKPTFLRTWYWTTINKNVVPRDPFVQDVNSSGSIGDGTVPGGVIASGSLLVPNNNVGLTEGLPFCYDPLWRSLTGVMPNTGVYDQTLVPGAFSQSNEARFGDGLLGGTIPYILKTDSDKNPPSAYGLQRLSNFIPYSNANLTPLYPFTFNNPQADGAGNIFTSIDDIVFNPTGGNANTPSSVLPDMSSGLGPQADYKYTWFVTGRQTDAGGNGTQFVGEVVLCDGRQFGFDPIPGSTTTHAPAGEGVYEAIFGVGKGSSLVPSGGPGFAVSNRSVVLRWRPSTGQPDPPVRVGGWICDVTYERNTATYISRRGNTQTSFARCNWYQVTRRTDPQADTIDPTNYRQMVLTIASPLKAQTLLNSSGAPVYANVALVMPSVINVFPRSFEVH